MPTNDEKDDSPNPHLQDADTGTKGGVPPGAAQEESKGVPDSGRQASEAGPHHPKP